MHVHVQNTYRITQSNTNVCTFGVYIGTMVDIFLSPLSLHGGICFVQHVDLSVVLAIAFFSQEKRWNRPDVLHCSWPLYFHCTVAALKIVLARGSCDIFPTQRLAFDRSSGDISLPQRLVLARGSDDIVLVIFLCSHLTTVPSIFPLAFGGIPLDV